MTTEPGQSTAALYSLQSNKKICEALPVLQTDKLTFQSSTFSLNKWREKVPIAEGQRSLHNY